MGSLCHELMKRSLRCHSNRGAELSCGTTVRGPCQAADHFRALRCLSVVWEHEHDIRSHLAHWYPSITNLLSSFYFSIHSFFCLVFCFVFLSQFLSFFSRTLPCFAFLSTLALLPHCLPPSLILSLLPSWPVCTNAAVRL